MKVEKTASGQVGIMKRIDVSSLNRRDGFISFGLFNNCTPFWFLPDPNTQAYSIS